MLIYIFLLLFLTFQYLSSFFTMFLVFVHCPVSTFWIQGLTSIMFQCFFIAGPLIFIATNSAKTVYVWSMNEVPPLLYDWWFLTCTKLEMILISFRCRVIRHGNLAPQNRLKNYRMSPAIYNGVDSSQKKVHSSFTFNKWAVNIAMCLKKTWWRFVLFPRKISLHYDWRLKRFDFFG